MPATCATPVLIPAETLATRITELAREIEAQYGARTPVHLICVLKGGFVFLADLVRQLNLPVTLDFISMSSYAKGTTSSGEVKLVKDLDSGIQGRDVIVVEDIVDTGLTLQYLLEILQARGPRSLKVACLLNKPSRRKVDVTVDFVGFTIADRFVVGFGLDFEGAYRHLPYIGLLDGSVPPAPPAQG
ncbi:MAG: hypoxanthine phosphoribosyltransferase [Vicinamibacterales bacterium]